ncbi:MAG: acyl carrier protein [Akkermansiaceae bacterium]|nr:acyl carrier protein [Akkermansiaceae bacterium]
MTRQEVDQYVRQVLESEFDCDVSILNEETNIFETFDLDSIDAVDIVVRVQKEYGISLQAEDFKLVRNYGDLLDVISKAAVGAA